MLLLIDAPVLALTAVFSPGAASSGAALGAGWFILTYPRGANQGPRSLQNWCDWCGKVHGGIKPGGEAVGIFVGRKVTLCMHGATVETGVLHGATVETGVLFGDRYFATRLLVLLSGATKMEYLTSLVDETTQEAQ